MRRDRPDAEGRTGGGIKMTGWIIAAYVAGCLTGLIIAALISGAYDSVSEWRNRKHEQKTNYNSYYLSDDHRGGIRMDGGDGKLQGGGGSAGHMLRDVQAGEPGDDPEDAEQKRR